MILVRVIIVLYFLDLRHPVLVQISGVLNITILVRMHKILLIPIIKAPKLIRCEQDVHILETELTRLFEVNLDLFLVDKIKHNRRNIILWLPLATLLALLTQSPGFILRHRGYGLIQIVFFGFATLLPLHQLDLLRLVRNEVVNVQEKQIGLILREVPFVASVLQEKLEEVLTPLPLIALNILRESHFEIRVKDRQEQIHYQEEAQSEIRDEEEAGDAVFLVGGQHHVREV